ncbi:tRNA pseudouridine synthase A isoform X2 [Nilaparvata lugens]|uniref:tRNA pseudouridine synthase A isoform X2 n=1 Tax=Nilaparvata lugens TaxID=108931 RepID=UPI000B99C644|nr:tRNA pseudouridine synthase A isoform X2 [Nilaparvata lugens]
MLKLLRSKTDLIAAATKQLCNMSSVPEVEHFADTLISLKRKVEQTPTNTVEEKQEAKRICTETERVKRKKVALVLAYSGQGYLGLQRNPNQKTIEEDLLVALKKANAINDEIFKQPQLIQFQRAARTDKGVSALRQVISLKLPEELKVEDINSHLPDQIRVIAMRRVTKGFNSKSSCDGRTYSYMLPTFALAPLDVTPTIDYRISKETLDKVNHIIAQFKGTHNFHNFTSKKKPWDPSAMRYMVSLHCSEPAVCDGMEFTTIYIRGQSFMLHQIRKMVGLTIAIARGMTPLDTITKAYDAEKLDLPVAPGLGLVLEEPHYERYNARYGSDGIHEPLDWTPFKADFDKFKANYILPSIVATELQQRSMLEWLDTLSMHTFDVRTVHMHDAEDEEEEEDDEDEEDEAVKRSRVANVPPRMMGGLAALEEAAKIVEAGTVDLDTLARVASDAKDNNKAETDAQQNTAKTIST